MDTQTLIKTAYVIKAGCAVALIGIAAYAAKQQYELNKNSAELDQKLTEHRKWMKDLPNRIHRPQQ